MATGKMGFEQFMDAAGDRIKDYLPEAYQDADVILSETRKLNASYMSMQVKKPDQTVVASVNLNAFYEDYRHGVDMEAILREMAKQAQMQPSIDVSWLGDYQQVKDKLFIRVCEAEENRDFLNQVPHRETDGLAVTYHIRMQSDLPGAASVTVTNDMLKRLGVSQARLDADAVENAQRILPPVVMDLNAMMQKMMKDEYGDSIDADMMNMMVGEPQPQAGPGLTVLTNSQNTLGAAAMFYPGLLQDTAEKMQADLFVLPSSVHEVLLMQDDGNTDYRDLEVMVQGINATEVAPTDRLSDHVYHYDVKDQVLERADSFERRMREKEAMKEAAKDALTSPFRRDNAGRDSLKAEKNERQTGRRSVLARLNQKKEEVNAQPKRHAVQKSKDHGLE